jgi:cell wall-associated NlpC family hydrolase
MGAIRCPRWRALFMALLASALAACSSSPYRPAPPPATPEVATPAPRAPSAPIESANPVGHSVVEAALAMLGAPYRYGGASPAGFDCSGLVQFAYRAAGIDLPRTTESQLDAADRIDLRERRAGDLLFFRIESKISHVGIYVGDGEFVHAPSSGRRVSLETLGDPYWRERLVFTGRID